MPSFVYSQVTQTPYTVVEDDINITVLQTEPKDQLFVPAADSQNISDSDRPKHAEEEVEIDETLVMEKKSARPFHTLLTGAPDPVSTLLSLLTFLINVGLVLATIDLVYHAKVLHPSTELSFARMGYMYVHKFAPTRNSIWSWQTTKTLVVMRGFCSHHAKSLKMSRCLH